MNDIFKTQQISVEDINLSSLTPKQRYNLSYKINKRLGISAHPLIEYEILVNMYNNNKDHIKRYNFKRSAMRRHKDKFKESDFIKLPRYNTIYSELVIKYNKSKNTDEKRSLKAKAKSHKDKFKESDFIKRKRDKIPYNELVEEYNSSKDNKRRTILKTIAKTYKYKGIFKDSHFNKLGHTKQSYEQLVEEYNNSTNVSRRSCIMVIARKRKNKFRKSDFIKRNGKIGYNNYTKQTLRSN